MQRQFFRLLKTKCSQFHARYTINPLSFKLQPPTKFTPQSVVIFSTPTNLPQVIEDVIELHQQINLQVVVAGIDSMAPLSARNGVSELWLDRRLKIGNSLLLEERDDLNKPPPESDGINPVSARKNWKNIQGHLSLGLRHEMDAKISLANTVFSTGSILTLFYFDSESNGAHHSGQHLCELEVALPRGIVPNHATAKIEDRWTPLYPGKQFKITNCVGNLLKSIERNPAAKYLENNDKLMSLASKDTEVFVKLRKRGSTAVERFKVTAGGGGWGAKADIIALSPEAKPERGDEVEFFMVTPKDRFVKREGDALEKFDHTLAFISSFEETDYDGSTGEESEKVYDTFGCGSELGFYFNGVKHHSPGETVYVKLK
ncbi:hypothetical protein KGF57_003091 [Candida theae]|uniref:Uncharacterized protein n=1 Tax=Candida theae TaxID=1198502 RepID=A0AAD5BE07_9ASCO|nr:uncharacterized protein KGF57_003091 [Candida theae]KAI5957824.1 hypothetical protein KGF57_003091 [Candida theae]